MGGRLGLLKGWRGGASSDCPESVSKASEGAGDVASASTLGVVGQVPCAAGSRAGGCPESVPMARVPRDDPV